MALIVLAIDGDLCGPMSIGTVAVIRALQRHLGLSLEDASQFVDRCVFEHEKLTVPAPTRAAARALLDAFGRLPAAPRIHASIAD